MWLSLTSALSPALTKELERDAREAKEARDAALQLMQQMGHSSTPTICG